MDTTTLAYDSLKTVLSYMEANLRFQLSTQIPSIRFAEKAVPLKINNLSFGEMQFEVNETKYNFGIYRKHNDENMSQVFQRVNAKGGAELDLDNFGLEDTSTLNIITPGDVLIEDYEEEEEDNRTMEEVEQDLRNNENLLALVLAQGEHVPATRISGLQDDIEFERANLISLCCKLGNLAAPFEMFIQVTITTPHGKQIKRLKYSKKLYETMKHLTTSFFGKRGHIVQVKTLNINGSRIIRLPLGLKFKIKELILSVNSHEVYEALKPILDDSSYPLDLLQIDDSMGFERNEQPVIPAAETLIFPFYWFNWEWLPILKKLPNSNIILKNTEFKFQSQDQTTTLIHDLLKNPREVATVFSFGFDDEKHARNYLEFFCSRFNRKINEQNYITLQINNNLELKISQEKANFFGSETQFIVRMEVAPNESALVF